MRRFPLNDPYVITTQFGVPDSNAAFGRHSGIDAAVPVGRDVFAPCSGTITDYTSGKFHGNVVQIYDGQNYISMYHNSSLAKRPGDQVSVGELVAKSGNTGLSTGPHVHFQVCKVKFATSFNDFINPNDWLKQGGNTMYPNEGDITNYSRRTGWPGHAPNANDMAYWTKGTGNPNWPKGADYVWKALIDEVTLYQLNHPAPPASVKELPKGIWEVK